MSLRDRIANSASRAGGRSKELYERFGLSRNPFPPAGEPSDHPHLATPQEEKVNDAVVVFDRDHTSQVLLIEGTQGVGKTNLLSFFQSELQDVYLNNKAFYIIRYYPDPESSFDGIIRRLFQELGEAHVSKVATKLAAMPREEREAIVAQASGHEFRLVLHSLVRTKNTPEFSECVTLALEWLVGLRLVKRHREVLGVQFRLDTVESKTQALRDLVFCSSRLGLLKGIFLLLDELEKQDYSVSKMTVLRYLSAIRALIDSLPRHLFLLVALTTEARRRYFEMLPAFAGRLQNIVALEPLKTESQAIELANFYVKNERRQALELEYGSTPGTGELVIEGQIRTVFRELYSLSAEKGLEGVSHRDFLHKLHVLAEEQISKE
jgi:hypothetical protein